MNVSVTPNLLRSLSAEHRSRLMRIAREVNIPQGTRLFEEGGRADRFWIVRSGSIALDMHVPGRRSPVIETLGFGDLVGWSWLFEPYTWQLGAEAATPVRAHEFDAVAVRMMCADEPEFAQAIEHWVGQVLAHRLQATRTRLLDLYAPYGSGSR
ncbi:cyclic nucleotide-binding domain-containing protein [Streptomyces sp. HUCO-GS316]|uniref:cyclic nucleotide-binding domain-containing protein n=1 Tax=Streptomyces sp. HUCO-GS316 TaxID=2692198 RepID=UPI00136D7EC2|nr:cyclic nucleotide-binding domain-containing protein [Streptomyces sp. HUCO-GS316]MXM69148.1 cyclic nucleotide-binding domain-containing protein [Streptomyces sp. HUCO-GS316]